MVKEILHILLLEDNPGDALLIMEFLKENGSVKFSLVHVEQLKEGLENLNRDLPDVILLDLGLPDSQGLDSLQKIVSQAPMVPVIVLTGLNDSEIAVKAMQAGAQDYLVKGEFNSNLLMRVIQFSIERKQAEDDLRLRTQEAETLRQIAASLTSSLELNQVLDNLLSQLAQVIGYDSATVFLHEDKNIRAVVALGLPHPEKVINQHIPAEHLFQEIQKTHQALVIPDVQADPRYSRWGATDYVRGWMGIPLIVRDEIIGYLTIDSYKPGAYDETHSTLALAFANQAAIAIHNARLFTETHRRLADIETVNRISTALRGAQTVEEMFPLILDETLAVVGAEAGSIYLFDAQRDEIRKAVARGWYTQMPDTHWKADTGMPGEVLASGKAYQTAEFVADLPQENVHPHIPAGWGGIIMPISIVQEIIGLLFVSVQLPRQLTSDEVRLLTTISEIAGNAIHRAGLHEQTKRQVQRLAALRDIDITINSVFNLNLMLDSMLNHVTTQLGVDAADILLFNPKTQILESQAGRGFRTIAAQKFRERIGEGHAGLAAFERRIIGEPNNTLPANPPCNRIKHIPEEGFVAHFVAPLITKGGIKGVLEIFHRTPLTPNQEWLDFLEALGNQIAIGIDNFSLFDGLQRTNIELVLAYDATIEGWSRAMDLRDKETEGHSQRVTDLSLVLAVKLGLQGEDLVNIRRGALLHDFGKMGVPDNILLKPGKLTEEEWEIMRRHPQFAFDLFSPIDYLRPALDIPYCHHEKWDGSGYPRGLIGEQIPLAARLFAVVDVWDALTSDRPYRKAWTKEAAIQYVQEQKGKHFDPKVADTFIRFYNDGGLE